ncbi:MAG: ABC transporter ATP-binding protein [Lachnospiraceae bacterium]
MNTVMELQQVTKNYGNGKGIFDVTFSVKEGEVFGYLGPNGAGKTTTIRQLLGFIHPDQGSCQIFGKDCFHEAGKIQEKVGYLAGELAFMEDMTGMNFLKFIAELKGMKDTVHMEELMEYFELNPSGKIRKMSKGMKQKIGIVCAFMNHPKAVILDEPTSGLDPLMQNKFVELILEEKKKGTTILMSSHIFEEIEKTCDRTAIIRDGKIAAIEYMDTLAEKKKKIYTVTLKNDEEARKLIKETGLDIRDIHKNKVQLLVRNNVPEILKIIAAYEPIDLEVKTQSLEELFLHYYGKDGENK